MSNYPDGMTSRDWAHIDGIEHHEDCPQYEDYDMDCECDTLYPFRVVPHLSGVHISASLLTGVHLVV